MEVRTFLTEQALLDYMQDIPVWSREKLVERFSGEFPDVAQKGERSVRAELAIRLAFLVANRVGRSVRWKTLASLLCQIGLGRRI